ncbi:MAG: hypothetical protein HY698_12020 [Deltaproteobacteria bacterium]|nr:hypothetical protein [Deltaproteobacteria bacterium]
MYPQKSLFVVATGAAALAVASTGCPDRELVQIQPEPQVQSTSVIQVGANRDLDILFVIDNSVSMGDEHESLIRNFPEFMRYLEDDRQIVGGLPNVHIGVVSSDVGIGKGNPNYCSDRPGRRPGRGDDGVLQNTMRTSGVVPSCPQIDGTFIEDVADASAPDGRRRNYRNGSLANTFACMANLGTEGCFLEQHLEAMKRALAPQYNPENTGFLRKNAFLAVIILADEDDCSAKHEVVFDMDKVNDHELGFRCYEYGVECNGRRLPYSSGSYSQCTPIGATSGERGENASEDTASQNYLYDPRYYANWLKALKSDPSLIMVAGIIGPATRLDIQEDLRYGHYADNTCPPSGDSFAAPAIRLQSFLNEFGSDKSPSISICGGDLRTALSEIAKRITVGLSHTCLPPNVETTSGRAACEVIEITQDGTKNPLPFCPTGGSTDSPCWTVQPNNNCPNTPDNLAILRQGPQAAQGTTMEAYCSIKPSI